MLCFECAGMLVFLAPIFDLPVKWLPRSILGVRSDHAFYLGGIALFWCCFGLAWQVMRQNPQAFNSRAKAVRAVVYDLLIVAAGVLGCFLGAGLPWALHVDGWHHYCGPDIIRRNDLLHLVTGLGIFPNSKSDPNL